MVQVFDNSGFGDFQLLWGAPTSPNTLQQLEQQLHQPSAMLSQAGQALMDQARQAYHGFINSDAMSRAHALKRQLAHSWQRDLIRPLFDIGELQNPPPDMVRFLAAEPSLKSKIDDQMAEGWPDLYKDPAPCQEPTQHYDYRRVMSGAVVENDDSWQATTYLQPLLDGDRELLSSEKFDIRATWRRIARQIEPGAEDPSSPWNARL